MKLALWYHCRLEGGTPCINPDFAMPLMADQMKELKDSGLDCADEIHIVSNGGHSNLLYAAMLAPEKSIMHDNGPRAESHLPTVNLLRQWLPDHPDWAVLYFHSKGVTHPGDATYHAWRKCMDRCVLTEWRRCVHDLQHFESVGPHWLTPEQHPGMVKTPFWGGMFFWATARFLLTLPSIPQAPQCREDWFLSEGWIGMGPRRPRVRDYRPHWPSLAACNA